MRKNTTYGQRGGEGATRGKKAAVYDVILPDGEIVEKRTFTPHESGEPVGYVYVGPDGKWYCTAVGQANLPNLTHYTQTPAVRTK